ncbi:alpha/beta fold hydrolase [Parashewanella curva]|uniref:Alpha/beta fold hydrolase n=1 Tax=Parashewanella curva TaxID=2338552 RepID=A0A3L8PRS5_9GAMM|nr:alpha/beta fold hydrolase [Parashewanella curva]RLV58076.1 alpha/beta fold hydrolase [Parashewanella curva]
MAKDLHEKNQLVRWGILVGITFLGCLITLILIIDYEIIRNPEIMTDRHIQSILIFMAVCLTVIITSKFISLLATRLNSHYLKRFKYIPELSFFEESRTKVCLAEKKYEHIVLLFHGFTASPQEFQFLTPYLKTAKVDFVAPIITGFGLSSTNILSQADRRDWYRKAVEQYEYASSIANKVSIIGHSMGGILACFVAMHRPVEHLILSGPGLYSVPCDLKYKRILLTPVMSEIYEKIIPYLPKPIRKNRKTTSDTLDSTHIDSIFQYLAIPVKAARQIFNAQDEIELKKMQYKSLSILYGKQDLTVDMNRLLAVLDDYRLDYTAYCYDNSAHNIFEDFDRKEASKAVVEILTSEQEIVPVTSFELKQA